jgi:hypothetical protein
VRHRTAPLPASSGNMTNIYLVCFHSVRSASLKGMKGQYLAVEKAIADREWPCDNGDDPSFYVARRGGLLTWGVCRQNLRNAIAKGSIVVFFSFTTGPHQVVYRLSAVATVVDKLDHRAVHVDRRFSPYRRRYINVLIAPTHRGRGRAWQHDEDDRPGSQRHKDWLWRIADHSEAKRKEEFERRHASIYDEGWFAEGAMSRAGLVLARNYVVFSSDFIARDPVEIARSVRI